MRQLFLLVSCVFLFSQPQISLADNDEEIWSSLKNGGMVVLMRHASVNSGKGRGSSVLRDPTCLKEVNLSEKGKKEAAGIGKLFADKKIQINTVLNSPYCRTTDTAKIAFNSSNPVEFLSLLEVLPQAQADINSKNLMKRIGSFSGKGNLILITHQPNILAVSFETVEKGAFLVLKPMGGVEFEELGKIKPKSAGL